MQSFKVLTFAAVAAAVLATGPASARLQDGGYAVSRAPVDVTRLGPSLPGGDCTLSATDLRAAEAPEGCGVDRAYVESFAWYLRAAEQGNAAAMGVLAMLYEMGLGVAADQSEALKWYRLAAEKGDVPSQVAVAKFYAEGRGVPRDLVSAYMWYRLAVAGRSTNPRVHRRAEAGLASLEERLSAAQLAEAERRAVDWALERLQPSPGTPTSSR